MDITTVEYIQIISWIIAMGATIITALLAIKNFKKSIRERQLDLLWKQANSAKEFVHEMHENINATAAVSMLDWFSIDIFKNEKDETSEIKYTEVLEALSKVCSSPYTLKERYILECFDWFFYFVDRLEQHVSEGLFQFKNVKFIFYPYYKKIDSNKEPFYIFMRERNYLLAPDFWKRFEDDISLDCP